MHSEEQCVQTQGQEHPPPLPPYHRNLAWRALQWNPPLQPSSTHHLLVPGVPHGEAGRRRVLVRDSPRAHAHTRTHTHAHTRAREHTHTHLPTPARECAACTLHNPHTAVTCSACGNQERMERTRGYNRQMAKVCVCVCVLVGKMMCSPTPPVQIIHTHNKRRPTTRSFAATPTRRTAMEAPSAGVFITT